MKNHGTNLDIDIYYPGEETDPLGRPIHPAGLFTVAAFIALVLVIVFIAGATT